MAGRIKLIIDHTKIGAMLNNFPVFVSINKTSGRTGSDLTKIFSELSYDTRKKIKITIGNTSTQCYVEIIRWNDSPTQAYLWVKVPSISDIEDTVLYLTYDITMEDNIAYIGDTGSPAAEAVWTGNNYVAVYHLTEEAGDIYFDSSPNRHDGRASNKPTPSNIWGQLFTGGQFIAIPSHSDFSQPTTGYLEMSMWLNPTTLHFVGNEVEGYAAICAKANYGQAEWQWVFYNDNGYVTPGRITAYAYNLEGHSGAGATISTPGSMEAGKWSRVGFCMTPTSIKSFLNDIGVETYSNGGYLSFEEEFANIIPPVIPQAGSSPIALGAGSTDGSIYGAYEGHMAEVRFSNVERSPAWKAASYFAEGDWLISSSEDVIEPPVLGYNFFPGTVHSAVLNLKVSPPGAGCFVEVFIGPSDTQKYSTSGRQSFLSTGENQLLGISVPMPTVLGTFHVYIDLYFENILFASFIDTDVTISNSGS